VASSVGSGIDAAARALRHRDRSTSDLRSLLVERGVDEDEVHDVLDVLTRARVLDDSRYAESRARALAARHAGDAYIRHDLARSGLSEAILAEALATLEPEPERAARVVARRGASARTARYLAGRGFSDDVVRGCVAHAVEDELG
jgi:regulatory protein